MKLLQKLFTFALLTFGLALAAQAQTSTPVVRITGSTAYRGATHTAIRNILGPATVSYAYFGSNLSGANQAIFVGTVGSTPVIVKTSWSGSAAGIQTVVQNLNVNFLADDTGTSTGAGTSVPSAGTTAGIPDIALSDTYQIATPFNSTTLTDIIVGVVPFQWVASKGSPAALDNVTPQLAKQLFGAGSMALSLWTGNPADAALKVYATGRDPDSGTRLTAFAETGVGVGATVVQFQPVDNGTAITGQAPWPLSTVNGIQIAVGNGGFSSGSALATIMNRVTQLTPTGYYVTYLSTGDAATAITAGGTGAVALKYNGASINVPGTNTFDLTALKEGRYTFWSYAHLMFKNTLALGTPARTVADALANQIKTTDATLKLDDMKVERFSDGGLIRQRF